MYKKKSLKAYFHCAPLSKCVYKLSVVCVCVCSRRGPARSNGWLLWPPASIEEVVEEGVFLLLGCVLSQRVHRCEVRWWSCLQDQVQGVQKLA